MARLRVASMHTGGATVVAGGGGGSGGQTDTEFAARLPLPTELYSNGIAVDLSEDISVLLSETNGAAAANPSATAGLGEVLKGLWTDFKSLVGSLTETAPATDTASSGVSGRLQRVAQRLTSLIALVPASLGSKADAASLAVTQSTEDKAVQAAMSAKLPATLGSKADAASMAVTQSTEDKAVLAAIRTSVAVAGVATTATLSTLASTAASQQLLASTATRLGLTLYNTDVNGVYVKYGTTASATSFTVLIPASGYWEMPRPIYTGRIDAIWAADGSGSLFATELT